MGEGKLTIEANKNEGNRWPQIREGKSAADADTETPQTGAWADTKYGSMARGTIILFLADV